MRIAWLLALGVAGCSDAVSFRPVLDTEPARLSAEPLVFGPDGPGESSLRSLQLTYEGERPLDLFAVSTGDGPFDLAESFEPTTLYPGDHAELDVVWTAPSDGRLQVAGELSFDADSHLGGVRPVPLLGLVATPDLRGQPVDLGVLRADCDVAEGVLVLRNLGSLTSRITAINLDHPEVILEPAELPLNVAAGGGVWSTRLLAEPRDVGTLRTQVRIDHQGGVLDVPVTLRAVEGAGIEDRFVQEARTGGPVSLLMHLDRSRSMDDDTRALAERVNRLVELLDDSGREWRIGVVVGSTTGCGVGPPASDLASVEALLDTAVLLPDAHLTEAPYQALDLSLAYMGRGECNEGLDLNDGSMHLLVVSDEPDQSAWGWELALGRAQGVRPDLVVHAVTGPVPDGCETAEAGLGHVDAAWKTGGGTWSICERWAGILEDIGMELSSERRRWRLSKPVYGGEMEVLVDDVPTTAFTYEPTTRGIELAVAPAPGSVITVRYRTDAPCKDQEEG